MINCFQFRLNIAFYSNLRRYNEELQRYAADYGRLVHVVPVKSTLNKRLKL
jgi:hypothetical protein